MHVHAVVRNLALLRSIVTSPASSVERRSKAEKIYGVHIGSKMHSKVIKAAEISGKFFNFKVAPYSFGTFTSILILQENVYYF